MNTIDDPGHISLTGIAAMGHHGVLESERRLGQPFIVDVDLELPVTSSDDLSDTVNYATVAQGVVEEIEGDPVDLIETLAGRIADRCLAEPLVRAVAVTVHKPHAPVGVTLADAAVTVRRRRS